MSRPTREEVEEALRKLDNYFGPWADPSSWKAVEAAARAWLEPDYEAAISAAKATPRSDNDGWDGWLLPVRRIVDAALGQENKK